jgi:hypothetical protein
LSENYFRFIITEKVFYEKRSIGMGKRMLDCVASDFAGFSKEDFLSAIAGSEGRVIACESIGVVPPMLGNITNAEFTAAMGADILLLNMFDVEHLIIQGLPDVPPDQCIRELKRLTALIWNRWKVWNRRKGRILFGRCRTVAGQRLKMRKRPVNWG